MRLLSFLDSVEAALRADGLELTPAQVSRQVDYQARLARMELPDGCTLMVQNFTLADGQFCLKAWWQTPAGQATDMRAFFDANGASWSSAARQLAATKPEVPSADGGDAETPVLSGSGLRSAV